MTATTDLRALLAAATPGPWNEDGPFWVDPPGVEPDEEAVETRAGVTGADRVLVYPGSWETKDADAALIAAAINALPDLLDKADAHDRLVAAVEGLRDEWRQVRGLDFDPRDCADDLAAILTAAHPDSADDRADLDAVRREAAAEAFRNDGFPTDWLRARADAVAQPDGGGS